MAYKYAEYRKAWRARKKAENPEAYYAQQRASDARRDKAKTNATASRAYHKNRAKIRARQTAWRNANPELYRECMRKSNARPESKIRRTFTSRLGQFVVSRTSKFQEFVGASPAQLRAHLESQFKPGWTWDNHGTDWEIYHILPLSSFDLTRDDQIKIACNWQNLRPLAKAVNRAKSAQITEPQMPLTLVLA